jgi:hypothetical protein
VSKRRQTITDLVREHAEELRAAETHRDLYRWAVAHELDTRHRFPVFKRALREIGIDYEALRARIISDTEDTLRRLARVSVLLYVDANAGDGRFAICDEDGGPVRVGGFSFGDRVDSQASAELEAAKKAVWLASKIRDVLGEQGIALTLMVDAEWLTYRTGKRSRELYIYARRLGVALSVRWIPGSENPADRYTRDSVYIGWRDAIDRLVQRLRASAANGVDGGTCTPV